MFRICRNKFIYQSTNQLVAKIMKRSSIGSPTSPIRLPRNGLQTVGTVENVPDFHQQAIQQARPYQVEILEEAIKDNTIVCLGTGTGKTFISVMLIRDKQDQIKGKFEDGGKRTFFLVNTVPLAEQQAKAVSQNTSLKVKHYTGDMGVDFWDQDTWVKEFNENDVLVMTAQILVNILTHGFFTRENINLLIMDECHNATKKHPYVRVMEFLPVTGGPHIMGLTASIINEKYKKSPDKDSIRDFLDDRMKILETTMRSKCITCSDREATSKYATKPVESVLMFSSKYEINDFDQINLFIFKLKREFQEASEMFDLQKKQAKVDKSLFRNVSYFDVINRTSRLGFKDACAIASDAVKLGLQILETLGPISTFDAIEILSGQLEKHKKRFSTENGKVLRDCSNVFNKFETGYREAVIKEGFGEPDRVIPLQPFITNKAHVFLTDVLLQEKLNFQRQNKELHAIMFVQRRCTAIILSQLIQRMVKSDSNTYQGISSEYVLGHGFDENIRLADSFMKSTEQSKILTRFKAAEFNILVATSVVEEGLDVRKCNLVVRFDGIFNYREYAQSKGRARAKDSKFIVMASEEDYEDTSRQLEVMQKIESVLFDKCQDRELPTEDEIREQMFDEIDEMVNTIFSEDGNARIKPHYAVSLLYRYCSFLQQDIYSSTNPVFRFHKCEDGSRQAECLLPLNFPLPEKVIKSAWMPDKDTAKKDAASKICAQLKDMGELTKEHLLPVDHREKYTDLDQDANGKTAEGTRKNRSCYTRNIPKLLQYDGNLLEGDFHLFVIEMTLTFPYDKPSATATWPLWYAAQREGFGLILPAKDFPKFRPVKLYTRSGEVTVTLRKLESPPFQLSTKQQESIERFSQYMSTDFYKQYIPEDLTLYRDDTDFEISKAFVVILTPEATSQIQRDVFRFKLQPIDFMQMDTVSKSVNLNQIPDPNQQQVIRKTYLDDEKMNRRPYYVVEPSTKIAGDFMEGNKTFAHYYQKRYNRPVDANSLLMQVVPVSRSVNYHEVETMRDSKKESGRHKEELVPELCQVVSSLSSQLHMQAILLPYFLYRFECGLNADDFRNKILSYMDLPDAGEMEMNQGSSASEIQKMRLLLHPRFPKFPAPSEIFEALTTRQALFDVNLERLEMLGDAFLKQAVSIFLFFKHPTYDEGRLTLIRKQQISNKNLRNIAVQLNAASYVNNSHFGDTNRGSDNKNPLTVWLPPAFKRSIPDEPMEEDTPEKELPFSSPYSYQVVQDKSLADCMEALIGAFFQSAGVKDCLVFMNDVLKIPTMFKGIHPDEHNSNRIQYGTRSCYSDFPKAASAVRDPRLRGDSEEVGNLRQIKDVEDLYQKGRLRDVEQTIGYTFKDKSHLIQATTHLSYIGNAVTGCYQEYEFLGDAILDFLVTLHVFASSESLSPGKLTSIKSSLVNNNVFSFHIIRLGLHKYLSHHSPALVNVLNEFTGHVTDADDQLYPQLYKSPFIVAPPGSHCGLISPKVFGDLLESLAGAVFLDSGMDLMVVWKVFYPIMRETIEAYIEDTPLNPKREMHEKFPNLKFEDPEESQSEDKEMTQCKVVYDGGEQIGSGKNKKTAQTMACYLALQKLKAEE
uniref:Uncharacterized protein n=1 Tax=Clytia hemisphaerica TaxID=252671 RepID=A0A7M5VDW2_9CNID